MTATPTDTPRNPGRDVRAEAREQRRAAALRANLQRRKAQARARVVDSDDSAPGPAEED